MQPISIRSGVRSMSATLYKAKQGAVFARGFIVYRQRTLYSTSTPLYQGFKRSSPAFSSVGSIPSPIQSGASNEDNQKYHVPQNTRDKVISAEDAVALVRDGDTVCVSGFVCQGTPEALLKALGKRFEESNEPKDLTLLFGGGPGMYTCLVEDDACFE